LLLLVGWLQSVFFELSVPGNDEVDVHHIVYEDFFSALGSLAARKYLYEDSVTAAVNNLLANNILPHACRGLADPKADELYVGDVLDLFAAHEESLKRVFCFYKRQPLGSDHDTPFLTHLTRNNPFSTNSNAF